MTTERALEQWAKLYSASADHAALALRLADASAGYTLTTEHIATILAPADADRATPDEEGISRSRTQFAEVGIVWPRNLGGIAP